MQTDLSMLAITPQQTSAGRSTEAWQLSHTFLFHLPILYSQNLFSMSFQEAGLSRALIVVESSSSDEPIVRVGVSQAEYGETVLDRII